MTTRDNAPFPSLAAARAFIERIWRQTERELADYPPPKRRRNRKRRKARVGA